MSSYMNRVWMAAASVSVVNSHPDQAGQKLKYGKKLFSSSAVADSADLRPLTGVLNSSEFDGLIGGGGDDKRKQAEESLHRVMYLNCWGGLGSTAGGDDEGSWAKD
ncbi:hypothetical protein BUALT_Bualt03G0198900 [Buddleja alternifolia]|uniref:Uncharacterized protein n=1 Tax=Buddleja alternifolia TaxID=168488 RepID=A0AAV6XWN5_9LAMI|nr:hypothetical protein BUALT_Bualt03G0198900 [Buddleja alternifolia]